MLGKKFTDLVEDCLLRLDHGEELLEILADHPDDQERIKPLLLVAMASRAFPIPVPNMSSQRSGKNNLLSEMALLEEQDAFRKTSRIPSLAHVTGKIISSIRSTGLTRPIPKFRLFMVGLIMVFGAGFFTLNASAGGYPGEFVDFFSSRFQKVLQMLNFNGDGPVDYQFGQFQFFSGSKLGFDEQVAQKADLLLDIEDEEEYQPSEEGGEGKKNQNKNGAGQQELPGVAVYAQDQDSNGLALGQDKDQDNNGLALGHDKDNADKGLALGHDKDQDDTNNNQDLDQDQDDKDKKEKIKDEKIKDK